MADIVDVFEQHANTLNWRFSYGDKKNRNLLKSNLITDEIYMILDPVTRLRGFSEFGGTGTVGFTGQFLLVVKSTIDQVYHNQTSEQEFRRRIELQGGTIYNNSCKDVNEYREGKYTQNIQPLLNESLVELENLINCSDYQITNWSIIDVIDVLDVNCDGVLVTFNVSVL